MKNSEKFRANTKFFLYIGLITFILAACSITAINWRMKMHARGEAKEKAMILLERNLSTHTYFSHQLKPILFKKFESFTDDKYFEPIWMSSTYAVREIDKYYHSLSNRDYYYKESAINARSPENEADDFERNFIEQLNKSSDINELSEVRYINGKPFFIVLRRGESMEKSCLRCHSTPEVAPADLVSEYGPMRSFQRYEGEVISAISIRIPLDAAYADINQIIIYLAVLSVITLLIISGLAIYLGNRWIYHPLNFIRAKALDISKNPKNLGTQIDLPISYELSELTESFNSMSLQLRQERDELETKILQRTEALQEANLSLEQEIIMRKKTIDKLENALVEVKTLSGLLPICSHCKKIRDDKGYWNQIEVYIHEHSDVRFSHGICQECIKKYYPDYDVLENEPEKK
jgi:hypothetical protein